MAVHLNRVAFTGFPVGVSSDPCSRSAILVPPGTPVIAHDVTFDGVHKPYDIGTSPASITRNRIKNDPKLRTTHPSAIGWTRPSGPPLPTFCPECKAIFASKNYVFGGAYFHNWGNEEQCIICGFERAQLSEGVFNLSGEVVRVLSGPDMTFAMLAAINSIADDLAQGNISPEEATAKFEAVSGSLADVMHKALKIGMSALFIVAAVAGIGSCYQDNLMRSEHSIERRQDLQSEAARDRLLALTLSELAHIHADLHGLSENPSKKDDYTPSGGPPKSESPPEFRSSELE